MLMTAVFAPPVSAQFKVIAKPSSVGSGDSVNIFLRNDSYESVSGFLTSIPTDWTVVSASNRTEKGRYSELKFEETKDGKVLIFGAKSLRFGDVILLKLKASGTEGRSTVTFSPFITQATSDVFRGSTSVVFSPTNAKSPRTLKNRVAVFGEEASQPVIVDIPTEFQIAYNIPYTLSAWVKTTNVNVVVLSSWTGEEDDDYAIEWVLDPLGYLEFYRGYDSKHVSMRSKSPVSDGNWHFLTFVYDPAEEWSRLAVDGEFVDSLFHVYSSPNNTVRELGLGGRLSVPELKEIGVFSGQMDMLRISPDVWNSSRLKSEMKRPNLTSDFVLDFENEGLNRAIVSTLSDFSFGRNQIPVSIHLSDLGVQIVWPLTEPDVIQYRVERSFDGVRFDQIAVIRPVLSDFTESLTYNDPLTSKGVVYYRLIPEYNDGPGDPTPILKIGLGELELRNTAVLDGNFPNPFNPSTTISYEVRENQHIRLSVWDLSGQMIATLVDATQSAGRYEVPFLADDLPSGTYFVRLVTDSGILTHQMILMK